MVCFMDITNVVRAAWVQQLGIPVKTSTQLAFQANGQTPMDVVGEVSVNFYRDNLELHLEALVVTTLDVLEGVLFTYKNDISVRNTKRQVIVIGNHMFYTIVISTVTRYLPITQYDACSHMFFVPPHQIQLIMESLAHEPWTDFPEVLRKN